MIGLINNLILLRQPNDNLAPNFNSPIEWGVATIWLRFEEDKNKLFEQRLRLISPDTTVTELPIAFLNFDASTNMRMLSNIAKATGFPVGQPGIVTLATDLREAGNEQAWETVAEYPIEVIHQLQEGRSVDTS